MSTHNIPPATSYPVALALVQQYVRQPEVVTDGSPVSWTFTPDLTAPQVVTLGRIFAAASSAVSVTPGEWAAIEDDIAGLQTYQNLPTPTLAQTVLAVKAQSRIIRALLRS